MAVPIPYRIYPLGDRALTIDLGNKIDEEINRLVISAFQQLQKSPLPAMIEAVPAYSTLAIYYHTAVAKKMHPDNTAFKTMKDLTEKWLNDFSLQQSSEDRLIEVPVWYFDEFKEVSIIHMAKEYRVYMNILINNGPKMSPMKPNILKPIITPNTVVSGCTLPSFFNKVKRSTLSTVPMIPNPNITIAMPCPV